MTHDTHLGSLVKQVDMACERQMNNHLRQGGLTRSQVFVLHTLMHHGGQATLKQIEAEGGAAQSTTWGVVRRLEEKGLVELASDPGDARAKVARLTPAGRTECEEGWRGALALEGYLRQVFTPEEHTQLTVYLERMRDAVNAWEGLEHS